MKRSLVTRLIILFSFFASLTVSAQNAEMEEIVIKGKVLQSDQVNALKIPTPIINVPQSLSIVTDEEILKKGMRSIGDIIRYTPGVNTSQGKGTGTQSCSEVCDPQLISFKTVREMMFNIIVHFITLNR